VKGFCHNPEAKMHVRVGAGTLASPIAGEPCRTGA